MTREDIEQLNVVEPYCFETDREEQWYQVGLQYGLEVADEHPKSPWISVKDDLPCNHRELIHNNYTTKYVLALDNGYPNVKYMSKLSDGNWHWPYAANVTHWMPIPKLDEYNIND